MKNLLLKTFSLLTFLSIVTVSTIAYFNDAESSEDNSFVAGTLDLKIDSECSYEVCSYDYLKTADNQIMVVPPPCRDEVCVGFGNWSLTDLTTEKFFDFTNLKVGDNGEDTISYHVSDNDAYGCFSIESKFGDDCVNCQTNLIKTLEEPKLTEFELTEKVGLGNCAQNAGYNPACIEKEDNWEDEEISRTHTVTNGIINVVFIKAGTTCYKFTQDTSNVCYTVSGIGTSTVTVSENWNNGLKVACRDISHTEYVVCKDPLNYLKFFSWHDDGDNIFEPMYPQNEMQIFGPIPVNEFLNKETYTLANLLTGAIPANSTKYIGLAWCLGEMNINYSTGEITCQTPSDPCICGGGEDDVACLDIEFYIEQARHNSGFSCEDL